MDKNKEYLYRLKDLCFQCNNERKCQSYCKKAIKLWKEIEDKYDDANK